MYELIQVGENSFYMDCPSKVGFWRESGNAVWLIDSGSDRDAAKKVKKLLDAQGWTVKAILNTHSHADHIGGNQYLQNLYGCPVYAPGVECAFTRFPVLEPTLLYGGYAMKELQNKFLMAKASDAALLTPEVLPAGLELLPLPGHCYEMAGFRTDDGVVFLADCLSSEETLAKYQVGYLYDVGACLETLEMVKTLEASRFVPSHAAETTDIVSLAQANIDKVYEISDAILDLLTKPLLFEDLLAGVFRRFDLTMNLQQRMLLGSTLKSYLSWLKGLGKVDWVFENCRMLWKRTEEQT